MGSNRTFLGYHNAQGCALFEAVKMKKQYCVRCDQPTYRQENNAIYVEAEGRDTLGPICEECLSILEAEFDAIIVPKPEN